MIKSGALAFIDRIALNRLAESPITLFAGSLRAIAITPHEKYLDRLRQRS